VGKIAFCDCSSVKRTHTVKRTPYIFHPMLLLIYCYILRSFDGKDELLYPRLILLLRRPCAVAGDFVIAYYLSNNINGVGTGNAWWLSPQCFTWRLD